MPDDAPFIARRAAHFALIALLVCAIYAPSLGYQFVYDDYQNFAENRALRDLNTMYGGMDGIIRSEAYPVMYHHFRVRALPYLSFWLNQKAGGISSPWQWRIVNIALHAVMCWLVYMLVEALFTMPRMRGLWDPARIRALAIGSALVYATHPLMTETVAYVTGRVGQMAAVFYLASIVAYIDWRASGRRVALALSLLSGLLAMFSKETAATLPLMAVMIEWMSGEGRGWRRLRPALPLLALLPVIPAAKIMVALSVSSSGGMDALGGTRLLTDMPRQHYLFTQFSVLVRYIRLIFLPTGMAAVYDWPVSKSLLDPRAATSLAELLLLMAAGAYALRRSGGRPALQLAALSVFGFFLTLSVESSVFPIIAIIAEGRTYLPIAFVVPGIMGMAMLFAGGAARRFLAVTFIVCAVLAVATMVRARAWSSESVFWETVVRQAPNNVRGLINLAYERYMKDDAEGAARLYDRAAALGDDKSRAEYSRGIAAQLRRDYAGAAMRFSEAIRLNPSNIDARIHMADALESLGRYADSSEVYEELLRMAPGRLEFAADMARVLVLAGQEADALKRLEALASAASGSADALYQVGVAYQTVGHNTEAAAMYRAALLLDPAYNEALERLRQTQ